jgi:hypothetical protein
VIVQRTLSLRLEALLGAIGCTISGNKMMMAHIPKLDQAFALLRAYGGGLESARRRVRAICVLASSSLIFGLICIFTAKVYCYAFSGYR